MTIVERQRKLHSEILADRNRLREALEHIVAAHNGNPVPIHYKVKEAIDRGREALQEVKIQSDLPQWYLDDALPRLKRIDELSLIAYPKIEPQNMEGREKMLASRQEWDRLMREQMSAECDAGL